LSDFFGLIAVYFYSWGIKMPGVKRLTKDEFDHLDSNVKDLTDTEQNSSDTRDKVFDDEDKVDVHNRHVKERAVQASKSFVAPTLMNGKPISEKTRKLIEAAMLTKAATKSIRNQLNSKRRVESSQSNRPEAKLLLLKEIETIVRGTIIDKPEYATLRLFVMEQPTITKAKDLMVQIFHAAEGGKKPSEILKEIEKSVGKSSTVKLLETEQDKASKEQEEADMYTIIEKFTDYRDVLFWQAIHENNGLTRYTQLKKIERGMAKLTGLFNALGQAIRNRYGPLHRDMQIFDADLVNAITATTNNLNQHGIPIPQVMPTPAAPVSRPPTPPPPLQPGGPLQPVGPLQPGRPLQPFGPLLSLGVADLIIKEQDVVTEQDFVKRQQDLNDILNEVETLLIDRDFQGPADQEALRQLKSKLEHEGAIAAVQAQGGPVLHDQQALAAVLKIYFASTSIRLSYSSGVVLQDDGTNFHFGTMKLLLQDIQNIPQTGLLQYTGPSGKQYSGSVSVGLIRLMFLPVVETREYDINDALAYLTLCRAFAVDLSLDSGLRKYNNITTEYPRIGHEAAISSHQVGRGLYPSLENYQVRARDPGGLESSGHSAGRDKVTEQTVIDDSGKLGKLHIDVARLRDSHHLVATHQGQVVMNKQVGEGLKHILTSKRMGKKMREVITPQDIQDYHKVIEFARVRPKNGTQQRTISELAIVELGGMNNQQLIDRLDDLIASIGAGNSRGNLIRNEAIAIVDELLRNGVISLDEKNQIIENNSL
jgi:hypothetical protein